MKELVGQGKPFYSAVDKAAGLLKRKVGTGAEFMQELKGLGGIKQSEIEDRGLGELMGAPKMTHEQFMSALAAKPAPKIRELNFSDKPEPLSMKELRKEANNVIRERAREYASEGSDTSGEYRRLAADEMQRLRSNHMGQALRIAQENQLQNFTSPFHEQYTLPGGENYREMLIKAPEEGGEMFAGNSNHFGGEPGILASMRLKDRTGPNGEKLLHLEELQSDWHQQGREHGYKDPPKPVARTEANPFAFDTIYDKQVPDAPFKKNWEEMALKRLIHHAAEKGYNGIVVTPGAEQADRYSMAQHVDEISHYPRTDARTGEKSKSIRIDMKSGNPVQLGVNQEGVVDNVSNSEHENFKGKHISDIVGKEHAKNIMGAERGQISGEGLTVGGEGMKGFYDKKVPNILNAIGKKHGVKTQMHGHRLQGSPEDYANAVEKLGIADIPMAQLTPEQNQKIAETADKRLHHFPITEEMRKDVLTNGLPLHREGGIIRKAVGGQVQPSINQMRMALLANGKSAFGDIQNVGANEAPNMDVKAYINPDQKRDGIMPVGGVTMGNQPLPVGGVDMSQQGGQQLMPPNMTPPPQQGQPQGAPQGGMPPIGGATNPLQQPQSNILQMTPQGQAMSALKPSMPPPPQGMAMGGGVTSLGQLTGAVNSPSVPQFSQGGLEPHPLPTVVKDPNSNDRPMVSNQNMDNGATNYTIDNFQQMANGGEVQGYASKGKVKQTVQDPQRMAYSGIYGNPKEIAALAASRVAPEDPLLKQLFGVTRADMYQLAHGRQGSPHLGMLPGAAANPKGSMAAQGVMNKKNEQRLIDVMSEARQHQGLAHGMEPWYYMDPLFDRMVQLVGLQKATEEYKKMNALMGMASSSSEVNTEIPRGSLAYFLQNQGRFDEFVKHGGKRDPNRPADFGEVPGHLAHKTAHALPMKNFLTHGAVSMDSPKVPMYIEASGVPATGFQTRTPVGDAHWSRAVGLADTRNKKTSKGKEVVPGQSVSTPEMSDLGPWWQQKIAKKLGMESVPAQALAWGAFSPQTGVTTPIGAPKLELISKQIGQTAQRLGVSPQTARDLVLTGKERIGMKKGGNVSMDQMQATLTLKKKKAK